MPCRKQTTKGGLFWPALSKPAPQETDGYHIVNAQSENSGEETGAGVSQAALSVGILINKLK